MWYFSWILGLGLASTFGVLNAIWYDIVESKRELAEARRDPRADDEENPAP
jgi:cyd operon protein YbgT